jgi:hypothetical protein
MEQELDDMQTQPDLEALANTLPTQPFQPHCPTGGRVRGALVHLRRSAKGLLHRVSRSVITSVRAEAHGGWWVRADGLNQCA